MKPYRRYNKTQKHHTTVMIDDVEMEVEVHYRNCRAEPDVGFDGGVEIEGVYFEDEGDIQSEMTEEQLELLAIEIGGYFEEVY